jgi:TolA-binding protein
MQNKGVFYLLVVCSLSTASCAWVTTKTEGEALREEVRQVEARVEKIDSYLQEEKAHLTEMIERARSHVEQLEETLTRATRVLARNSADFGADMETIKDKLREVDGALAEIRYEVEESQKKVDAANLKVDNFARAAGLDVPVDSSQVPETAEEHIKVIKDAYAADRYGEVRSLCELFLARHPKDQSAELAQYYIAKTYLAQKRWAKALGALKKFTDSYPKSKMTPEVLYEMSRAFFSLGDCTDARILTEALTTRHAKSPFAAKAKKLNEQMKKNKALCTS